MFPPQGIRIFESVILRSVRFEEAAMTGQPVVGYAAHYSGAEVCQQLMQEMIACYDHQTPNAD